MESGEQTLQSVSVAGGAVAHRVHVVSVVVNGVCGERGLADLTTDYNPNTGLEKVKSMNGKTRKKMIGRASDAPIPARRCCDSMKERSSWRIRSTAYPEGNAKRCFSNQEDRTCGTWVSISTSDI
jgi:hypothetical protein